MLNSALFPLLTIASMVQAFPLDIVDSPVLSVRATGEVVAGGLNANSGTTAPTTQNWGGTKSTVATTEEKSGGAGSASYQMYTGDGKSWPSQDKWIGDFETMYALCRSC